MHGDDAGLSQPSMSRIVQEVSFHIAQWRRTYISFPSTPQQVHDTQNAFYQYCRFPGATGAIDCTYIPIRSPGGDPTWMFVNQKGRYSVNVQVCLPAISRDSIAPAPGEGRGTL